MERRRAVLLNVIAVTAAFVTYYCMYAYRKPFAVLELPGNWLSETVSLKAAVIVSQIIGYTCAKFVGTRYCSALSRDHIFVGLIGCIAAAEFALLLFGWLPESMIVVAMFLNGLSLGMVWGIAIRPLEGRGTSEMLIAGLCCAFVLASGDVKSTGRYIMESEWFASMFGDNLRWMPFATGLVYLIPFAVAAYILAKTPRPVATDVDARSERRAMTGEERREFVRRYASVLIPLAATYFLVTAYRDYRDNYQADMLAELAAAGDAGVFSVIERRVAFVTLAFIAALILIRGHLLALRISFAVMISGLIMCLVAEPLRSAGTLDARQWMMLTGVGGYLCYIPFNCILFERFVAYTRSPGNAVFAIMLFDGIGYTGSMTLIATADVIGGDSRLVTFDQFAILLGIIGIASLLWTAVRAGQVQPVEG